jgi:hypothetical protein
MREHLTTLTILVVNASRETSGASEPRIRHITLWTGVFADQNVLIQRDYESGGLDGKFRRMNRPPGSARPTLNSSRRHPQLGPGREADLLKKVHLAETLVDRSSNRA